MKAIGPAADSDVRSGQATGGPAGARWVPRPNRKSRTMRVTRRLGYLQGIVILESATASGSHGGDARRRILVLNLKFNCNFDTTQRQSHSKVRMCHVNTGIGMKRRREPTVTARPQAEWSRLGIYGSTASGSIAVKGVLNRYLNICFPRKTLKNFTASDKNVQLQPAKWGHALAARPLPRARTPTPEVKMGT